MKRALLLLAGVTLPACIADKTTGIDSNDALVDVTWSVRSVGGLEQPCPTGTPTAQVIAQPVDPLTGEPTTASQETLFDCGAKSGTVSLVPDSYVISVHLLDADGSAIYAASLPSGVLDLTAVDVNQAFDIYTDGGYLALGWTLTSPSDGVLACETAGVTDIVAVLTPTGSGGGVATTTAPIPCVDGTAITSVIPAGAYRVLVRAEATGTAVGSTTLPAEIVRGPNELTAVGTIAIPIPAN